MGARVFPDRTIREMADAWNASVRKVRLAAKSAGARGHSNPDGLKYSPELQRIIRRELDAALLGRNDVRNQPISADDVTIQERLRSAAGEAGH